jgi:RsiW-degrading membrane proteinase PrsW (M82 family)
MAWTGLTAAALWTAAEHRFHPRSLARFAGVYVVAVVLHTIWDSIGDLAGYAVLSGVSLTLLTVTAHRATRENRALAVRSRR